MKLSQIVLFAAVLSLTGCGLVASVVSHLPDVIAGVTKGLATLDAIQHFIDMAFAINPNAAAEKKVDDAIAKARSTLIIAQSTAQGSEDLDQKKIDAAFAEFTKAYQEVLVLCAPYGVHVADTLSATQADGALTVPSPESMTPHIKE